VNFAERDRPDGSMRTTRPRTEPPDGGQIWKLRTVVSEARPRRRKSVRRCAGETDLRSDRLARTQYLRACDDLPALCSRR